MGYKCQLDSLSKIHPRFLSDQYVPQQLKKIGETLGSPSPRKWTTSKKRERCQEQDENLDPFTAPFATKQSNDPVI